MDRTHPMNILFCSVPFHPSVGGIETVSALLAERFHRQGHRVILVTQTPSGELEHDDFEVVRRPSAARLFELVRWSDVVFHNNISLRLAWPLLVLRRPWVVAHHTWIPVRGLAGRLKRLVLRHASHIAVSWAVADSLPVDCRVVPNPYADDEFVRLEGVERTRELVFVGRLVSDKGVEVLIDALALLVRRGRRVRLTVIGDGPELPVLRQQATRLGVASLIDFAGRRTGQQLVAALNAHHVLVVPSVWEEPFGVVALEAMACGCPVLSSARGSLAEVVGAAADLIEPEDCASIAAGLARMAADPEHRARLRAAGLVNARRFDWHVNARQVREVYAAALAKHRRGR